MKSPPSGSDSLSSQEVEVLEFSLHVSPPRAESDRWRFLFYTGNQKLYELSLGHFLICESLVHEDHVFPFIIP